MRLKTDGLITKLMSLGCILVLSTTSVSDEPVTGLPTEAPDSGFSATWHDLQTTVDCLLHEHIAPPTRQQMYLSSCRALYAPSELLPPGDLSEKFSGLTTNDQFREIFARVWAQQTAKGIAPDQLQQLALTGIVASAVRPLSSVAEDNSVVLSPRFVSEKENRITKQLAENQYVGIGIKVGLKGGYPQILEPFYGGAAQKAGARDGDLIVSVNGVPSKGRAFQDIIEDLRGQRGSTLKVTLRHESEKEDREYTMVRDVIPIATVMGQKRNDDGSWALELPDHPQIAYLKITDIVGSTAAELIDLARKIEKQNFRAVILDFTETSGNSVPDIHHASMLADALLGEAVIGDIHTKDNNTEIRTQADHVLAETPLVILSPRAVTGPEFLVLAALKNNGRGKLVGSVLSSRGLCTKSIELNGLGAIEQLPYALAIPRGRESTQTTERASHAQNLILQVSEDLTLTPDCVIDNPTDLQDYLKAALELIKI